MAEENLPPISLSSYDFAPESLLKKLETTFSVELNASDIFSGTLSDLIQQIIAKMPAVKCLQ